MAKQPPSITSFPVGLGTFGRQGQGQELGLWLGEGTTAIAAPSRDSPGATRKPKDSFHMDSLCRHLYSLFRAVSTHGTSEF